mmetsp:Transcript_11874/g.35500  ORF Transcript_11874/g.35500 Transcript_11874/m.35500 type:complete len:264 (-) Transcript_11874:8-799(-)
MRPSSPLSRWKLCSLTTCMSFSTKSAMRPFSPLSRWKLTVSAPPRHQSFSESLGPHIFRIFVREPTFMHRDEGRLYLNSEEAPRSSIETSATWELSKDSTWRPFSQQSKLTSLRRSSGGLPAVGAPTSRIRRGCHFSVVKKTPADSHTNSTPISRTLSTAGCEAAIACIVVISPLLKPAPPRSAPPAGAKPLVVQEAQEAQVNEEPQQPWFTPMTTMCESPHAGVVRTTLSCNSRASHCRCCPGAPGAARLGPADKCSHRAEP